MDRSVKNPDSSAWKNISAQIKGIFNPGSSISFHQQQRRSSQKPLGFSNYSQGASREGHPVEHAVSANGATGDTLAFNQAKLSWQEYTSAMRKAEGSNPVGLFTCSLPDGSSGPSQEHIDKAPKSRDTAEQAANRSLTPHQVAEDLTPSTTAVSSSQATCIPHFINSHARGLLKNR
jgi:hypothetical protein